MTIKCSNCGFDNRPDARFCKQCGQPLQNRSAAAATPDPICPACGATAKPRARFCPRCGKPLAEEAAPAEAPAAQPPPAPPEPPATRPSMGALPQPYGEPPTVVGPGAQAARRVPAWVWVAGSGVILLCLIGIVVAAIIFGPQLLGAPASPTPAPTVTQPPEPPATATPTSPPPTTAPQPTAETPVETPVDVPSAEAFDAQVTLVASSPEVQVGDQVTLTITTLNSGGVDFADLRYQLLGEWEPALSPVDGTVAEHPGAVPPGESHTVAFVLRADQAGSGTVQANVTMRVASDPPAAEARTSEPIDVAVTGQ